MKSLTSPQYLPGRRPRNAGVALVIVLAFVVIITGVILAFFSQSLFTRQISDASANQTKADLLAQGASESIIADLQQEILLSSSETKTNVATTSGTLPLSSGTYFLPLTPASMLPQISGTTASLPADAPNLLKRSAYDYSANKPVYFYNGYAGTLGTTGTISGETIDVSSTTPSLNGRTVSVTRWNSHFLLPLHSGSDQTAIDSTPVTPSSGDATSQTAGFTPPDWVLISRSGTSPTTWNANMTNPAVSNSNYIIGRYAYAIYNEGGLLDANVAGFPVSPTSSSGTSQYAYKPALAFADLTQLGSNGNGGGYLSQTQVNQLVAWRNYASAIVSGTSFIGTGSEGPQFAAASGTGYYTYVTNALNTSEFMRVSGTAMNNGQGVLSLTSGQSDRMFGSRQELIGFMENGLNLAGSNLNVLNYLATFTRGLNQPSYAPDPSRPLISSPYTNGGNNEYGYDGITSSNKDPVNPAFLSVRVSGTGFTRNDGSQAQPGEPLVKKRFALSKLAWITYLGPSAYRTIPSSNPGVNNKNYDMWQLVNTYGISPSYLLEGTTNNILEYFGLQWQQDVPGSARSGLPASFHDNEYKWFYQGHNFNGTSINQPTGSISRLYDIANATGTNEREPDFFELLKAAVVAGSKAKGAIALTGTAYNTLGTTHPYVYQAGRDTSFDNAIIQLGANIIDEAKVDGYCTRIVFNDGVDPVHEFRGVENLPYMYRFNSGTLKLRMENPQVINGSTPDIVAEPTAVLKDPGIGLIMHIPTIWNPYDQNAPLGDPSPAGPYLPNPAATTGTFRMIADSISPDNITSNSYTTYPAFSGYAGDNGTLDDGQKFSTGFPTDASGSKYTTGINGTGTPITPPLGINPPAPGNPMDPNNSELLFQMPNATYYREPTIMAMAGIPKGSNLQFGVLPVPEYTLIQHQNGKVAWQGLGPTGGFLSDSPNPLNLPTPPNLLTQGYVGFPVALYPITWNGSPVGSGTAGIHLSDAAALYVTGGAGAFVTYRLQYLDPNPNDPAGSWVTYDEKYTQIDTLFLDTPFGSVTPTGIGSGNLADQSDGATGGDWQSYADPRTSRFAGINGADLEIPVQTPTGTYKPTEPQEWVDPTNVWAMTDRPDINSGYGISDDRNKNVGLTEFYPLKANGWNIEAGYFRIGMLTQNTQLATDNGKRFATDMITSPGDIGSMYYADPDGVVRGAMGAYNTSPNSNTTQNTLVGLPEGIAYPGQGSGVSETGTYQGQSRPYFLHRPFRSVAELGYVFSGTPWKNIDLFTPQSGDAPLLDVFSATETPGAPGGAFPLEAGVVNLNTRQEPVLQAILAGSYVDEALLTGTNPSSTAGTDPNSIFTPITGQQANLILTATGSILAFTSGTNTSPGQGPLENVSDLVGRWSAPLAQSSGTNTTNGYTGPMGILTNDYASAFTGNQALTMENVDRFREAFIRPLAAVGNTRVWNLLIDVVAQTGRYPAGTSNVANFVVDGEQRYWVHVAIDRFTGQVLDKQVEVVKQ